MPTKDELKMLQALPLEIKIRKTEQRIREFVDHFGENGVFISFSGGKDSTVLLNIVRNIYPNIEAVYVDTGLEYPEIRKFVKTFDNVTILRPKMRFDEVIKRYGYPMISKNVSHNVAIARHKPNGNVATKIFDPNKVGKYALYRYNDLRYVDFCISDKCCDIMKKKPAKDYSKSTGKVPILGTMTYESAMREDAWLHNGCNAYDISNPHSAPMSFWTEQDVLKYIDEYKIYIADVYGDIVFDNNTLKYHTTGCNRTGCIFCGYGCHLEKEPNRFQQLKDTHPKQYNYCLNGGGYNENGLWTPTSNGLGMKHIFDELNTLYGQDFIKYE